MATAMTTEGASPKNELSLLREEQRRFRRRVLLIAGISLLLLGPFFALSEWAAQTALHNAMLLSFVPTGLTTIVIVRRGFQRAAVALFIAGVVPVITWIHLVGDRNLKKGWPAFTPDRPAMLSQRGGLHLRRGTSRLGNECEFVSDVKIDQTAPRNESRRVRGRNIPGCK